MYILLMTESRVHVLLRTSHLTNDLLQHQHQLDTLLYAEA